MSAATHLHAAACGRRRTLAWLLAGVAALGSAAAAAQDITLRDDRGTEHPLSAPPQRIVSLLPSLTEAVFALGGGARLVGVDRYSNWPPEVMALPRLGGLEDASIEAIAALRPDVVLASTSARSLDRLEALGFRIVRLKSESHADVRRTLTFLAGMLGTPAAATRVWSGIEREFADAAARVPPRLRGQRVYFEIGGGPYAAGSQSFIGETLARLGLANIVPATLGPFPRLNPEFVLRAQPEIVIGAERDLRAIAERPGWSSLPAIRQDRLCSFQPAPYELLVRPGPRMGQAARLIGECLQRIGAYG